MYKVSFHCSLIRYLKNGFGLMDLAYVIDIKVKLNNKIRLNIAESNEKG